MVNGVRRLRPAKKPGRFMAYTVTGTQLNWYQWR